MKKHWKQLKDFKIEYCPVFSFLKLFKLGPQASIFQHPLDLSLKLALMVVSENTNSVNSEGQYVEQIPLNSF